MQAGSIFTDPRRSRRNRAGRRVRAAIGLATLLAVPAMAAYRVGRSQAEIEQARLAGEAAEQHERNRLLTLRLAEVEQQAEAAVARNALLTRELRRVEPSPDLRRLADLAAERLAAGVPASRLEFVLANAAVEAACDRSVEARRLTVRTARATLPAGAATFFGDRVIVTAEGAALGERDAAPPTTYDPAQPVTVRFLEIGGEAATVAGPLPLGRILVVQGEELRFAARALPGDPAQIEVTAQRCRLP